MNLKRAAANHKTPLNSWGEFCIALRALGYESSNQPSDRAFAEMGDGFHNHHTRLRRGSSKDRRRQIRQFARINCGCLRACFSVNLSPDYPHSFKDET